MALSDRELARLIKGIGEDLQDERVDRDEALEELETLMHKTDRGTKVETFEADARGRVTLGKPQYGDKTVKLAILGVKNDE